MNTLAIVKSGYQTIPLSLLDESSTNPRRTFEPSKLNELADSIRTHGLIQPITVRRRNKRFEIVAGARRFRAAQIAEQDEVPVRILDLDDAQTLEVQIIENSQRQDVHPYEEAAGYQRLLDLPGYDVATLALKCGKSQSHVYARMTLLQLIPEVAEAFQQDKITASHANLIARIPTEQQANAYAQCWKTDYRSEEAFLLPAKSLALWIDDNLYLNLGEAPFPMEDATLVPEEGACPDCPRRTGYNKQLFGDVQGDQCLDPKCYHTKVAVFIERIKAAEPELVQISTTWRSKEERREDELSPYEYTIVNATEIPASVEDEQEHEDEDEAEAATAVCDSTKAALITYGNNVGKRVNVCTDPDCAVHHPRRAVAVSADFEERQKKAQQEREARKKTQAKREKRFTAIMQRFPSTLTDPQTRFLLGALVLGDLDSSLEHMAMRLDSNESMAQSSEDVCAKTLT
jgi:ParB family transcriptional regulator, chromosome partitioning protein